jgi:hypothetical protein
MDIRAAPEIRPSSPRPQVLALTLALLLVLGPALARAAEGPAGHFLGAVNDSPATIRTDAGAQPAHVDLNIVLGIGDGGNGGSVVTLSGLDLSAPGVPTASGSTGTLSGTLKASATAPLAGDGRLVLALALAVHYPLIDTVFPPSPQPYLETFGGKLAGTLTYDAGKAVYRFDGTLHLSVRGAATEKVLAIDLPLHDVELRSGGKEARLYGARDRRRQDGVWRSSFVWVRR